MAEEKKPKPAKAAKAPADGAPAAEAKKSDEAKKPSEAKKPAEAKPAAEKSAKPKAAQKGKSADGEAREPKAKAVIPEGPYTPRLKKHYDEVIRAELTKQFGYQESARSAGH